MFFGPNNLDILEDKIFEYDNKLLELLLSDKTTRNNILWATNDYISYGDEFGPACEIKIEQITGQFNRLIRPRVDKSIRNQESRTKGRAEVFTPCWVCNKQNNLVDEQWFGQAEVFNVETDKGWSVIERKIQFPDKTSKSWKKYVDKKRLEVSCGEAPYLVSRYNTVTGEIIPINARIGLLDRKLRVVNENTLNEEEWFKWVLRAYQSVYGYEFQGDNLLLARENLLASFIDYYTLRFEKEPTKAQLRKIAQTIAWNIWQMDGIKLVIPFSCKKIVVEEKSLFSNEKIEKECPGCKQGNPMEHTGIYCKIYDWREDNALLFKSLLEGVSVND